MRSAPSIGFGLKEIDLLLSAGVPQLDAETLIRRLAAAERGVDPVRLALFASLRAW